MEQRYDLEFAGETLPGFEEAAVRRAVAALFKADERTVNRLFSGERLRIKRDCDEVTAQRLKDALERQGAKVYQIAVGPETTSVATDSESAEWSLAPAGSIIPGIPRPQGVAPDTAGFSIAPLGVTLGEPREQATTLPAPNWSLAPLEAEQTGNGTPPGMVK